MSAFFGLRSVFLFVFVVAGAGIVLGIAAAAVRHGANMFKKQGVAWMLTIVMVIAAIGVGYAKAPANNAAAPRPDYPAPTVPPMDVPAENVYPVESYVWDDARVLSERTVQELDERNARLWESYSVTIGVVTCNYGGDLYEYALEQAGAMNLGGYDFIVVLDISGDNYWLMQGADLLDSFSDETCGDYARDFMERDFARGDYDDAVLALTKALEDWYGVYYF